MAKDMTIGKKKELSVLCFMFTSVSHITVETGLLDGIMDRFLFAILFVWFIH